MKRYLWTNYITEDHCPAWPCPNCLDSSGREHGTTRLVTGSLTFKETSASKKSRTDEGWSPYDTDYALTAWARCSNTHCNQMFAISGTGGQQEYDRSGSVQVGEDEYEAVEDRGWEDYFSPLSCYPMPAIIYVPSKCPSAIRTSLQSTFLLFWSDSAACLSRLRTALEYLLDHLGVARTQLTKNGKPRRSDLSERIDALSSAEWGQLKEALHALRAFGNTGAHELRVSQSDLLDALEVLEYWLAEIIDTPGARSAQLTRKLAAKYRKR